MLRRPARKPERVAIRTEVVRVEQLTPHMIRVVVTGEGLSGFGVGAFTDHYVKLLFPPPGADYPMSFDPARVRADYPADQQPTTRTYTVRNWDAANRELTIDFVHHGDEGLAGPWAASARPGDVLQFFGPGGEYTPAPDADWHLFVGDESALPAIAASLRRVPAGVAAHVFIEVQDAAEQQDLVTPGDLHATWVHRSDARQGVDELVEAVRGLTFPAGRVHAFVHGEASSMRTLRRLLLVERSVPREALSISGYWKRGRVDETWRAEKAEWKRQVALDETAAAPPTTA